MTEVFSTEAIAWYGAIVASIVLGFDVWKWVRSRARLRVRIVKNVFYPDGGFSKVETSPAGETKTLIPYYHIEVTNIGELPTTIIGVSATTKVVRLAERIRARRYKFRGEMSYSGDRFIPHYGKALPYILGPGEVWSCRVGEDAISCLCQGGIPKLKVTAACFRRPIYIVFPIKESERSK